MGMKKFISYDLGTGGVKASLFDEQLGVLANSFIEYGTKYTGGNFHEQAPQDWWNGVAKSTRKLLEETGTDPAEIVSLALSGHSLVTVPMDKDGNMLLQMVPIWSDTRAETESKEFFESFSEEDWYMRTGNGFPAPCYSIFKLMWMKKNQPQVYEKTWKVLGSKDFINYKLTGKMYMDDSYASGTGAFDLKKRKMSDEILAVAGISKEIFPEIIPSHGIVGEVTEEAAAQTGLAPGTKVACGGVDNACMALGSVGGREGRVYTSLGSSSWIAVNTKEPVLDFKTKPYVFAHIQENMYTSAFSIFAGGSSFRWVRDTLCKDLLEKEDPYRVMTEEIRELPPGSNGVIFNPSLAGGTSQDKSVNIRGAFLGLNLGTGRAELVHAAMEGIAMNLKLSLDELERHAELEKGIQFCGGGARNPYWMQMFADVFNRPIIKTNIDQNAASIGAAAIAAKAVGVLKDYSIIEKLHVKELECIPHQEKAEKYEKLMKVFSYTSQVLADVGDYMKENMI